MYNDCLTNANIMAKKLAAFRLTDTAHDLLKQMSERQGVSSAALLEILIREKAAALGNTAAKF